LILVLGGAAAVIFTGAVDVAATTPDPDWLEALFVKARERAVERRAKLIAVPAGLGSPEQVAKGLEEYREMCAVCHGGPGREISELAQGLNPAPPQFSRSFHDDPASTFWIVKNGIKMTGMPAFGPTHDEETIWSIVAFLQKIDDLTPEQKQALARGGEAEEHHP
jgi:mono/diheme cytochrome c family protein